MSFEARPDRPNEPTPTRRRLGDLLTSEGLIDQEQLEVALGSRIMVEGRRERLGQTVVRLGLVSEAAVGKALAGQLNLPFADEAELDPDEDSTALVPPAMAERHRILPLHRDGDTLVVACADPTDILALDDVRLASGMRRVRAVVSTPTALTNAIRKAYGFEGRATELLDAISTDADLEADDAGAQPDDGPVVRLAEGIIAESIKTGASDIHIEPGATETVVRYRIDGVLHQVMTVPRGKAGALLSRLKLMSGMDIAERRRPQDGRAEFRSDFAKVDLRVSSLPAMNGEVIVIRLLRKGGERLTLPQIGFTEGDFNIVIDAVERPQGLVLITGPTGSGKTSTLYSFLGHLVDEEHNIITLEDPVEYELLGVNQTQINDRIGFTFAKALRTVLRQDPDVVMVGEIRDPETAELALQASLTGHLVFSTLHTNTAPSALIRLRDLDIPSYLVSSSLTMVLAQRLARRVCTNCAVPAEADERLLKQLRITARALEGAQLKVGKGCTICSNSGYRGRHGVFEVLPVNGEVRDLIAVNSSESRIRRAGRLAGMRTLREDGLRLARAGITTLEEVLRVTPADIAEEGNCPVCAGEVEPDFARCPWCGIALRPDACVNCDHRLQTGWKVCPQCGTAVGASRDASTAPTPLHGRALAPAGVQGVAQGSGPR